MQITQYAKKSTVLALVFLYFPTLNASSLTLFNKSSETVWVYIKKLDAFDTDWTVADTVTALSANSSLTESGNIKGVWTLPLSETYGYDNDTLRKKAKNQNLRQFLGEGDWTMSFAHANDGTYYLYFGKRNINKPVSILNTSDIHPIGTSLEDIQTLNMSAYSHLTREQITANFLNIQTFIASMQTKILNSNHNIRAVLLPGDNAGGYGKKSERDSFLATIYNPLQMSLLTYSGQVFTCWGNHCTYWESIGKTQTHMMEWIKEKHRNYLYAFNIGQIRCINLGLYPTANIQTVRLGDIGKNSLGFLDSELQRLSTSQPAIIFFHYPIHDFMSDWWPKQGKDDFYSVIKNHNIIGILVGHAHNHKLWKFRDKFTVIQSAYPYFTKLAFDPVSPKTLDITFFDKNGQSRAVNFSDGKEKDLSEDGLLDRISGVLPTIF